MTTARDTESAEFKIPGGIPMGPAVLWLGLAIVGCAAFFWDGIASLLDAWSRPEYSHGPLIPLIAGYLFLRELRRRPPLAERGSRLPGLLVVLVAILAGLLGNLTQIPDLITYALILAIGGLILLVAGARQGARFWVSWIYLFFMLPLPTIIYWQLSAQLQFLSSRLGVEFIQSLGIPVFLDGNIIDLGIYKLQVAEACSGLRYLFPLTSFGFLFAVLYRGPNWHKAILFLSSVPITIVMNSLRIGMIGVLVNYFGIAQADGFLHWFEGWIIFVACIALLYLEALLLQRLTAKPNSALGILDVDFNAVFMPLKSFHVASANSKLVVAALLLLISGGLWHLLPERAVPIVDRKTLAVFPMEIKEWRGVIQPKLDPVIEKVLAADEYLLADYKASGDQPPVNLFITYYNKTTGGAGIHSPEVCIPGGGWEVSRWQKTLIPTGDAATPAFTVNRAIIEKNLNRQLVYYWFEQRGRHLDSEYTAKFYAVWDAITRSRTDGALVRFVTPIAPGETEAMVDKRLTSFLGSLINIIPQYVPN